MRAAFIRLWLLLIAPCVLVAATSAQSTNLEPNHPHDKLLPTVTYQMVLQGETSPHYEISVDSSGNAAFRSREPLDTQQIGTGEGKILKFTIGQPTSQHIFELAREANYFEHASAPAMSTLDSTFATNNALSNTLTYSYGPLFAPFKGERSIRGSITYSTTEDRALTQLTAIFNRIYQVLQQGPPTQPINTAP